jgi:hypothetical protein
MSHPTWCDPDRCTAHSERPYGSHLSRRETVTSDAACGTTAAAFLMTLADGTSPTTVGLEVDGADGDDAILCPLTLRQVRRLHDALGRLLAATETATGTAAGTATGTATGQAHQAGTTAVMTL